MQTEALVGSTWSSRNYRRRDQYSRSWSHDCYLILKKWSEMQSISDSQWVFGDVKALVGSTRYSRSYCRHYQYSRSWSFDPYSILNRRRRDQYLILNNSLASGSAGWVYLILKELELQSTQCPSPPTSSLQAIIQSYKTRSIFNTAWQRANALTNL